MSTPRGDNMSTRGDNTSTRGEWHPQHTNPGSVDLLNLLRFSQRSGSTPQPQAIVPAPEHLQSPSVQGSASSHGRNISASDLVATLFGPQPPAAAPPQITDGPENTQDMLLRLLNRSQPGPAVAESPALIPSQQASPAADELQKPNNVLLEVVDENPNVPAHPETVVSPGSKDSMFTYVNPFDQLAAISPRNKSPSSGIQSPPVDVTQKQTINELESSQAPRVAAPPAAAAAQPPVLDDGQREAVHEVVDRLVNEIGRSLSGDEPSSCEVRVNVQEDPSIAMRNTTEATGPTTTEALSSTVAQAETTTEALADSWESAEDSAEKEEERVVSVYNFPMRPFISIAVKPTPGKLPTFRDDDVMDIARLKKEFDQLDRSLTAATSDYIVYALAKTGGIRIIRQDDGSDRQVFRSTRDRVFNVALCTAPSAAGDSEVQAILGIGISGSVYWALISRSGKDFFEMDALESESLIFPPFPASDENTSGGQLKTRAKRSTRHTNLFAIGRGKNIYVVSPRAAMNPAYGVSGTQRTVNTEKFFKERALKISTGKAGKDFAFSDDDSVIASLDKTGRLRFWDINDMLNDASLVEGPAPVEIRVPLTTFVTGSPTEKSWPTSVLFLDKLRAYSRSMALRYVLVGLKQNHTLQLWDIGLGKAVQELKFPHENESDAICSVAYHPSSGVIVVGHPTRNSIYFAHLSAPRYNLPQMSQAAYIRDLNDKDNTLPKPESTACLSGIREISLGSKGQLRSLELLPITKSATEKRGTEDSSLFELYVMHSRGVTCLNIKKEDLGWTSDNKVIRPIDAMEHGLIEISDLQTFPTYATDEPSVNGDAACQHGPREKKVEVGEPTSGVAPSRNASPTKSARLGAAPAVADKSEKKKKKRAAAAAAAAEAAKVKEPSTPEIETLASSTANMGATQAQTQQVPPCDRLPGFGFSSEVFNKHIQTLQGNVSTEFNKSLGHEFENLHRRFDEERRSWDAASSAKQDQVLRLVSSTLSDNVEKNLTRIVSSSIQADLIPIMTEQLNGVVSFGDEKLRQLLPKAIINAMQEPPVVKAVSDSIAQKLAPRIETEVTRVMQSSIAPMIESLARTTKKVESDLERHLQAQVKHYEAQRLSDNAKIEEMSAVLRGLSKTVSLLAANQGNQIQQTQSPQREMPQREILNASKRSSMGRSSENHVRMPQPQPSRLQVSAPVSAPVPAPAPVARSPEENELGEIAQLINAGHFEEGTIRVSFIFCFFFFFFFPTLTSLLVAPIQPTS